MKNLKYSAAAVLLATSSAANALNFDLTFIAGTSLQEQQSFTAAANMWSAIFNDNTTVKLTVGTGVLGANTLAQAGSRQLLFNYSSVRGALAADASSAVDNLAVANLTGGSSFGMLINRTTDNPNGAGSATAYVDNNGGGNNSRIRMTAANARALGANLSVGGVGTACTDCDAFIQFNSNFSFDHNRSDGISATSFDFIGIAVHEIGHAMGFISGVDVLDIASPPFNGPFTADGFTFVSTLDLFRWSAASRDAGVIDWTASSEDKFFSLDRGNTFEGQFSEGVNFGDGRQASHWKDDLGIGILDPTFARGELGQISAMDIRAFDAIGWNVSAVPEPETYAMLLAGLGLLGFAARRRKQTVAQETIAA